MIALFQQVFDLIIIISFLSINNCTILKPASIMAPATPFCFWTTQKHLAVKRSRSSMA